MAEWIRDAVGAGGYPALGGLVLVENLFPPIPSELILPLGGFYVGEGELNFVLAVLAATFGSVAGALILYAIARRGGRPVVMRFSTILRVTDEDLDKADEWFDKRGSWVVLFGRLVPGARSLVSIPAGLSEMPVMRFVALTTLGSAIWNTALIGAGWGLGSNYEKVGGVLGPAGTVILTLVVFGGIAFIVWNYRRRAARRSGQDDAHGEATLARGVNDNRPPCASATARTIDKPSPEPRVPVRPPRSNGSVKRDATTGSTTGPLLSRRARRRRRPRACDTAHVAAGRVVADAVLDQVRGEPLEQPALAVHARGLEVEPHAHARGADAPGGSAGDRGEVQRLAAGQAVAGASEHHQPVEQRVHLVDGAEHRVAHRAQFVHVGVRVGQRDVGLGADHGQRRCAARARRWPRSARGRRTPPCVAAQLAAGQRPAERGRDERRAGEREQVLGAELGQREIGLVERQRAVQVPRPSASRRRPSSTATKTTKMPP